MDFELNSDQTALLDGLDPLLRKYVGVPEAGSFFDYAATLDATLRSSGYLEIACDESAGPLEAVLVTEAVCKLPKVVEVAASAIVGPMVMGKPIDGPIALVSDVKHASRFLCEAKNAFVISGDKAFLLNLENVARTPVHSIFSYPMGKFSSLPDLSAATLLTADQTAALRRWWRVAIAIEAASAMQSAISFTVEYVSTRRQFGRALGAFQAIQHRLSERTVAAHASRLLTLEAAWREDDGAIAIAATYAQGAIPAVMHDLHQFNGALGITLDHPLHYWTYRLAALRSEMGGVPAQSTAAAMHLWQAATSKAAVS